MASQTYVPCEEYDLVSLARISFLVLKVVHSITTVTRLQLRDELIIVFRLWCFSNDDLRIVRRELIDDVGQTFSQLQLLEGFQTFWSYLHTRRLERYRKQMTTWSLCTYHCAAYKTGGQVKKRWTLRLCVPTIDAANQGRDVYDPTKRLLEGNVINTVCARASASLHGATARCITLGKTSPIPDLSRVC